MKNQVNKQMENDKDKINQYTNKVIKVQKNQLNYNE